MFDHLIILGHVWARSNESIDPGRSVAYAHKQPSLVRGRTSALCAIFTEEVVYNLINGLYSETSDQVVAGLIGGLCGKQATDLLYNHCH